MNSPTTEQALAALEPERRAKLVEVLESVRHDVAGVLMERDVSFYQRDLTDVFLAFLEQPKVHEALNALTASPAAPSEKPEPNPEWEAKADAAHEAIRAEVGEPNPFDTLTMLATWKAHAEPADCDGRITFSRSMLDSAHDALKVALEMARTEYLARKAAAPSDNGLPLNTITAWYRTLPKRAREGMSLKNLHDLSKMLADDTPPATLVGHAMKDLADANETICRLRGETDYDADLKRFVHYVDHTMNLSSGEVSRIIDFAQGQKARALAAEAKLAALTAMGEDQPHLDALKEAVAVAEGEYDHWLKEAAKHKRPSGRNSDHAARDLERARIARRIADKLKAIPALRNALGGGQS